MVIVCCFGLILVCLLMLFVFRSVVLREWVCIVLKCCL